MKDILMMVHTMGTLLPSDNDRYTYLANMLISNGAKVEIVTSDFEHHKKKYRDQSITKQRKYTVTYLHENSYQKNVSLKRIVGHISFAINLKKYLSKRKKPDVIYCAIPPTVSAKITAQYASKNNIKFVIDVQDLWPESFKIALGDNWLSKILLKPMSLYVNYAYSHADAVIAVSETYVKRVLKNNTKSKENIAVYLGTDSNIVEEALKTGCEIKKKNDEFWIGYVGNLGTSYDFTNMFKALNILQMQGITNIKLYLIGDGNCHAEIEKLALRYFPNTSITGYLAYAEMLKILSMCDIAINPIVARTASSVVNKVGDYAAVEIPVINTQDNYEYRSLLDVYEAGINTKPEDEEDIAQQIKALYENKELRMKMGMNNRRLFDDKFDRNKTYTRIVKCILEN